MARGELAIYTISSEYAYGSTGSPPKIPGGATLIFEIEVRNSIRKDKSKKQSLVISTIILIIIQFLLQLFEMEGEDISKARDKGIIKRTREAGEGFDHPNVRKIFCQRRAFNF